MSQITVQKSVSWGVTGVQLYYTVYDQANHILIARTAAPAGSEVPAGSGEYTVQITTWDNTWAGRIVWDDGSGIPAGFSQESFYATSIAISSGTPTIASPTGRCYFNTAADAAVIAATLPAGSIAAYLALTDVPTIIGLLTQASYDIDHAMRYQGRRYDTITQATEFPRVAYEPSNAILPNTGAAGIPGGSAFGSTIWDVDPITLNIQVPVAVTVAVVCQANYLATGDDPALDDQFKGIKSLKAGGIARDFDRSNLFLSSGLCRRAYALMWRYRLTSGRLL